MPYEHHHRPTLRRPQETETMTHNTRILFCLLALGAFVCLSCTSAETARKKQLAMQAAKEKKRGGLLPKSTKKLLKRRYHKKLPDNIETVTVKKGIPLYLFMRPNGILSTKPQPGKGWKNQMVSKRRSRSWYVRLKPKDGAKLGRYVFARVIMAIWNSAGGYRSTSRYAFEFLLRRGKKTTLLFSAMQLPKGQRYQAYDIANREINYENEGERTIKEGDILIFRVKHRSGNTGAVGLGGGLKERGNFFVIAPQRISDYYQYTK